MVWFISFVLLALCAGSVYAYFRHQAQVRAKALEDSQLLLAPQLNPLAGLPFEDALDSQKFALHVRQATEEAIRRSAASSGIHVSNLALEVGTESRADLVVSMDSGSFELVQNAHGTYRAVAKGVRGAVQEVGNIDLMASWLRRFAAGTAAIVTVSNIVSGTDAAKKLGELLQGHETLFAYRAIDQFAELRVTYEQLREELGKETPSTETLNDVRHRIRKTRHVLMAEAKSDLEALPYLYPDRTGLMAKPRMTWDAIVKRGGSSAHTDRMRELDEFRGKLLLARKCLDFERIAAVAAGVIESQEVLLSEAAIELRGMLPVYAELEGELAQGDSMTEVLASLFE